MAGVLGREPLTLEHMAKVGPTGHALDLHALSVRVGKLAHRACHFLVETRPATARMELCVRNVERRLAPATNVRAFFEEVVVLAGEWAFRALVDKHSLFFGCQRVH